MDIENFQLIGLSIILVLIVLILIYFICVYCYYIKCTSIEKDLINYNNELMYVLNYNEKIRLYNMYQNRIKDIYQLVLEDGIKVIDTENDLFISNEPVIEEIKLEKIENIILEMKSKECQIMPLGKYSSLYKKMCIFSREYKRWGAIYSAKCKERNDKICQRVVQLEFVWNNLYEIAEKASMEYPVQVRIRIIEILRMMLKNRKREVLLDKVIIDYECEDWNEYKESK